MECIEEMFAVLDAWYAMASREPERAGARR
jgi:hypothetical protein